jgi:hypothetical protein
MPALLGALRAALSAIAIAALLASAQSGLALVAPSYQQVGDPPMNDTPTPPAMNNPPPPSAQALVDRAVADAAGQTGLDPTQVRVVSVMAVDWPNSGLGCPEPGQAYAQVITPGFAIVVDAAGTRLSYHTDQSDRLIACEGDPLPEI